MRHRPLIALVAAALLVVAGCGSDDEPQGRAGITTQATDGDVADEPAATTSEPAVSTTLPPEAAALVLRGDGLGLTTLGAPPEEAVAAVTAALGAPTRDSGWEPAFSEYGTCPGDQIRGVEWDHLVLLFTDGPTEHGSGQHLFSWRVTGAPPAVGTATGFGYQATAADAEELYPGHVVRIQAEEPFPGFLEIDAEGGRITAYLDGADTVTNLEAGTPCGE
ncbi:MAG TPA: hypothetical protein VFV32_01895 [Acidimicrobiales bacterium]|jgi:hypothetical protein|nr:hypothetical protein [Acidimicrobiales bacterium]